MSQNKQNDTDIPPAIVPAFILQNEDISRPQKLLLGMINTLSQGENGYCTAWNATLANWLNIPKGTIKSWLTELKKDGYIKREVVRHDGQVKQRRLWLPESRELGSQTPGAKTQRRGVEKSTEASVEKSNVNEQGINKQGKQVVEEEEGNDEDISCCYYDEDSNEYKLTEHLHSRIRNHTDGHNPNFSTDVDDEHIQTWCDHIHSLLNPDRSKNTSYAPKEVRKVINWIFDEKEWDWPRLIRSAEDLRNNMDELYQQMKSDGDWADRDAHGEKESLADKIRAGKVG